MANRNYKTVKVENPSALQQIETRTTEKRGNTFNGVANTTLERYFDIIKVGRREVRKTFTDAELNLLCDICNGTMFEPFGMILENNGILMQYEDTVEIYGNHYHEKWQVEDLTEKLSNLSKVGQIALVDVIETFWNSKNTAIADVFKNKK